MKNILFPLKNMEHFSIKTCSLEGMPLTHSSSVSIFGIKDDKYEKFVNLFKENVFKSNLNNLSSDAEYITYINNMIKIQKELAEQENTAQFQFMFYVNEKARYEILERYIISNRPLPSVLKRNLFSEDIFNMDKNFTENLGKELNRTSDESRNKMISQWNNMKSIIDKDALVKTLKYFNKSVSPEIDNWIIPTDIELIAWTERDNMITELRIKYKETVLKALEYIYKNNIREFNDNYNGFALSADSFMSDKPLNVINKETRSLAQPPQPVSKNSVTQAILNKPSTNAEYMSYINNMIHVQKELADQENKFDFYFQFFASESIRYSIFDKYIMSNRPLPGLLKRNLFPLEIFNIDKTSTELTKQRLITGLNDNRDMMISSWNNMRNVIEKDGASKMIKYFNLSVSPEIDNWESPKDIERIAWDERNKMITEIRAKYKDIIPMVLQYKNNIKDFYDNNNNYLSIDSFISDEPLVSRLAPQASMAQQVPQAVQQASLEQAVAQEVPLKNLGNNSLQEKVKYEAAPSDAPQSNKNVFTLDEKVKYEAAPSDAPQSNKNIFTLDEKVKYEAAPLNAPSDQSVAQSSMGKIAQEVSQAVQQPVAQSSMGKIAQEVSQAVEEVPIFYKHCDMSGDSVKLNVGALIILDEMTLKNNISSIYIPNNYYVSLIDANNNVLKLDKSVNCLIDNKIENSTWNDRAVRVFIGKDYSVEQPVAQGSMAKIAQSVSQAVAQPVAQSSMGKIAQALSQKVEQPVAQGSMAKIAQALSQKVEQPVAQGSMAKIAQALAQPVATKYPPCPVGFKGPNSSGTCFGGYSDKCGTDCHKANCASAKGKWFDLDFSKNPYTCQMMPVTIDTKVFAPAQPNMVKSVSQAFAKPSLAQAVSNALAQKVEDIPIFYKHCGWSGDAIKLKVGVNNILDTSTLINNISSIYIPDNYIVNLFDANNNSLRLDKSVNCLIDNKIENSTWNDRAVRVFIGKKNSSIEKFTNSNLNLIIILSVIAAIFLIVGLFYIMKNKKKL
jgi:hypothetical protein